MNLEQVKECGKCCVTGKPLSTSEFITAVQLPYKATWKYPTWGNLLLKCYDRAIAYVHDDAIVNGELTGPILYAVEFQDDEIVYHDVSTLTKAEGPEEDDYNS